MAHGGFCVIGAGKGNRSGSDNTINALLACFGRLPIGGVYLIVVVSSDIDIGLGIHALKALHSGHILALTSPQTRVDDVFRRDKGVRVVKCLRDERKADSAELIYRKNRNGLQFDVDCSPDVK